MPKSFARVAYQRLAPSERGCVLAKRDGLIAGIDRRDNLHFRTYPDHPSTNSCECELAQYIRRLRAAETALLHYIIGTDQDVAKWRVKGALKALPS